MNGLLECIERLASADEAERSYAAEDIGYLNAPEGAQALLERLRQESSPVVRDAISQALTRIDTDDAIAGTIPLFESDDPQIRNLAVSVLRHKGERSVPFLKKAMREGDRDTRKFVLDALSGIPVSGVAEIYAAALSDEDPNVAITAVENIGNVRAGEFRTRIEDLLQGDEHPMLIAACLEALASTGDATSIGAIRRRFPHLAALPDFFLAPCLKVFAALGTESDFAEIARLLSERGISLRSAILETLLAIQQRRVRERGAPPELDEGLLAIFRGIVESNDPAPCRYQAVRVIGFWANRDDVAAFLETCLASPERFVRLGATEALRTASGAKPRTPPTALGVNRSEGDVR
jgi:hypothetical protein